MSVSEKWLSFYMCSRKSRRAEGARGFHLLAMAKTSAPQSSPITPAIFRELKETPPFKCLRIFCGVFSLFAAYFKGSKLLLKPQIHPFPVSRSVGKQGCAAEKCDFPCASKLFKHFYRAGISSWGMGQSPHISRIKCARGRQGRAIKQYRALYQPKKAKSREQWFLPANHFRKFS